MPCTVKGPLEKIKRWCAVQERSHFEVKRKLQSFGVPANSAEALLVKLIEENYLNEERFAQCFARGKFALKKWGRVKIAFELTQKRVSNGNIKTSLKEIDEADYLQTLQQLTEKKWALLFDEPYITRQAKTMHYLLQKGYELQLVQQSLKTVKGDAGL